MDHYRLVSNGLIVDAISESDALWIVENRHNYSTYIGARENAFGILSSDGGTVYHLAGKPVFHDFPNYADAVLEEISEDEYERLREELIANGAIEPPGQEARETDGEPEGDAEPTVKKSAAILALEKQVEELSAQNEMLTECLLEMSEIVYG